VKFKYQHGHLQVKGKITAAIIVTVYA